MSEKNKQSTDAVASQLQIPEFYANAVQVNLNAFEVELGAMLVDSKQQLKGALNLRLSPQTAAMLARILTEQMAGYEKQYGKIPLPG